MNIWRLVIDPETGKPKGDPEPINAPAIWAGRFSLAEDGSAIAYESAIRTQQLRTGRFDEESGTFQMKSSPILSGSLLVRTAEPSPDGEQVAFTTEGYQDQDLYVIDADGRNLRQLTDDLARDRGVTWGPDGSKIYFYSTRQGEDDMYDVWSIRPDGSGLEKHTDRLSAMYPIVSPDGSRVALFDFTAGEGVILPLGEEPATRSQATILPPLPDGTGFLPLGWTPKEPS